MRPKANLVGKRFEKLTVIEETRSNNNKVAWICKCDCGNYITLETARLTSDHRYSCGCEHRLQHHCSYTPLYKTWTSMKQRCYNPKDEFYRFYGGKGVRVCDEWKNSFRAFKKWSLEHNYVHGLQIDRIDVNGNYEPDNCRWVTPKVNANNRTNSRMYTIDGETKTLTEWCETYNVPYQRVYSRLAKHNISIIEALTLPKGNLYGAS